MGSSTLEVLRRGVADHFGVLPGDVRVLAPEGSACVAFLVRSAPDQALLPRAAGAFEQWARWHVPAGVQSGALRVRAFPDLPEEVLEAALLLGGPDGLRALVEVDDG